MPRPSPGRTTLNRIDRDFMRGTRLRARDRERGRLRLPAPARHDPHLRQSGLHRDPDVRQPAGGFLLRAGPAGGERGVHGRRLRPDHRPGPVHQPALGRRPRPCDGRHLHGLPRPRAARDRHRPAVALAAAARPVPVQREPRRAAEALREVGVGAGARRRRAGGHRQGLLHRHAAAARPRAGVGAALRLGRDRRAAARAGDRWPPSRPRRRRWTSSPASSTRPGSP